MSRDTARIRRRWVRRRRRYVPRRPHRRRFLRRHKKRQRFRKDFIATKEKLFKPDDLKIGKVSFWHDVEGQSYSDPWLMNLALKDFMPNEELDAMFHQHRVYVIRWMKVSWQFYDGGFVNESHGEPKEHNYALGKRMLWWHNGKQARTRILKDLLLWNFTGSKQLKPKQGRYKVFRKYLGIVDPVLDPQTAGKKNTEWRTHTNTNTGLLTNRDDQSASMGYVQFFSEKRLTDKPFIRVFYQAKFSFFEEKMGKKQHD